MDLVEIADRVLSGANMESLMADAESTVPLIKYSKGIQFLISRVAKKNCLAWRELKVYMICGPTGIGKTRFDILILVLINTDGYMIDILPTRSTSYSHISRYGLIIMREKTSCLLMM